MKKTLMIAVLSLLTFCVASQMRTAEATTLMALAA